MLELNNGSYYQLNNDEIEASVIHHNHQDGKNPSTYAVQIHTTDGGIVCIGYIPDDSFDIRPAQAIVNAALAENQDYAWWMANTNEWWRRNTVLETKYG